MSARVRLAALAILLAVSGAAWLAWRSEPPAATDRAVEPSAAAPRRFALRVLERSSTSVMGSRLEGALELRGVLVVQDEPAAHRTLLALERVESLGWTIEGREVEGGAARLEGALAVVARDEGGAVSAIDVPETTSPEVARVLRTLALALQALEPPASGRSIDVPYGRARAVASGTPERTEVRWSGADYERVAGARDVARVRADASHTYRRERGELAGARDRERLEVLADTSDEVVLSALLEIDLEPREGRGPALAVSAGPLVPAARVASRASRRALEGRVAGLTYAQMLADLVERAAGGQMPDHERWLWRASGLLLLEPERASELGRACTDGTLEGAGRALALDLLANVGHAEAQAALRAVLADPGVATGGDYPSLLQRAILVADPEDATLEFFEQRMDALEGPGYRASASALGALVGRARDRDPELGGPQVARLEQALDRAEDPTDRRALLMALGNARAREAEPRVMRLAASEDADERAAAVRALGRLGGDRGRAAVLERALSDGSSAVRGEALGALSRMGPTDAELLALAGAVRSEAWPASDLVLLVRLARRTAEARAPRGTDALLALIEALLAHPALPSDAGHQLTALRLALAG